MTTKAIVLSAAASLVVGCATPPGKINADYVSPVVYSKMDCEAKAVELGRVESRISSLGKRLEDKASSDAAVTAVGMILFWPSLFFIDGDGASAQEYARLKGEKDAILLSMKESGC